VLDIPNPTQALRSLQPGRWLTLASRLDRGGSLQARKLTTGTIQLYWRYSHDGRTSREPLGPFDASAPPKKLQPTTKGYGLAAALEQCRALAQMHTERASTGGLREVKAEARKAHVQAKQLELDRLQRTLRKLLDTYADHLAAQERRSHTDARLIFRAHVFDAWPQIADAPAADLTPDQVLDMLRRLIEAGKGRTANKLRSYLRAAYQCALDVRSTATIPVAFKDYGIVFNPAAQTRRSPQFDRADKRPLSAYELWLYWHLIKERPGREAVMLRLHLLTGGQRIQQLARLRWDEVTDADITLRDTKGRPGQGPRPHRIPLIAGAKAALRALDRKGEYALSTAGGSKPVSAVTLTKWAASIVGAEIADFQLKRVRSGVETLLAAHGISREIRGHLQSHGISGVQARHYDGHDYMREKHDALTLLMRHLARPSKGKAGLKHGGAAPAHEAETARANRFARA
jgi:integrase